MIDFSHALSFLSGVVYSAKYTQVRSARSMKFASLFVIIFCLNLTSTGAEYIVCATSQHLEACKRLEATKKEVKCLQVADSVECLQQLLKKKAHFGTFTPEEAILASYYIDDQVRVVAQVRHQEKVDQDFAFETVVVVGENFTGGLSALENSSYCHPGFNQGRYWSDRVLKYFESKVLEHFKDSFGTDGKEKTADEENLQHLSRVFRKACRPGSWSPSDWWDRKLKREFNSLCSKCHYPMSCSYRSEVYNEHFSALKCLTEEEGGVAYTALSYVNQYFNLNLDQGKSQADPDNYRFLCKDGSTRPLTSHGACAWIKQPWTAIVSVSSAVPDVTSFLKDVAQNDLRLSTWKIALRKIITNGDGVINFLEPSKKLSEYVESGRPIPKRDVSGRFIDWCTVSQKEKSKCEFLASASLGFGIPVQINCSLAKSKIECLKMIHRNESDITFIDTQLGFTARNVYNLTPAAFVETETTGNYYGVVVTKGATIKRFKDLKSKRACLPVYNGLGWLSHVQNIRRLHLVPNMLCSDSRGVWNYFSKACAPGAKSNDINKFSQLTPSKLCESCTANGSVNCEASTDNPYYSEIGALRCLNNGDGDVAILDFNTIKKFFESGSEEAQKIRSDDFKILCRDETVKDFNIEDPEECSITQLNGGEIVMKDGLSLNEKRDIVLTLIGIDDIFGHTMKQYPPTFKIYESFEGEAGLLFKDTSVALISVYDNQNEYVNNYNKLQSEMSFCHRDNGGGKIYVSLMAMVSTLMLIFIN